MNGRYWTQADIDTLLDCYGTVSADVLARRLGRTREALKVKAVRLGVNQRQSFLTGRDVAGILGVDSHLVARWQARGLLAARKSSVRAGTRRMWRVEVAALERFLAEHPDCYRLERITEEPWRTVARRSHADPLLSAEQAARELGVNVNTVRLHLARGWLPGIRTKLCGGPGAWRVRRSALAEFRPRKPDAIGVVVIRSVAGVNARRRVRATTPLRFRLPKQYEPKGRPGRFQPVQWRAS